MVYLLLGQGFEEIEAITVLDILRRANIETLSVGIGGLEITGGHNIKVAADITDIQAEDNIADMIILPGGLGGVHSIKTSQRAMDMIKRHAKHGKFIAAICAAPTVLGELGLLDGIHATCYPGCEASLGGALYDSKAAVVHDGNIITGKGPGTAPEFALKIVEIISGVDTAGNIKSALCL